MSDVKQRGRRRASSPVTHEITTVPGTRRAAIAAERAAAPGVSIAELLRAGAASGAGQKVGVAMAATGLVLAVALPATQSDDAASHQVASASSVETVSAISAPADIPITFAAPGVSSTLNPDSSLKEALKVNAANVTPQASKGTLSAPLKDLQTSSPFGYRVSPITGQLDELHTGQDFAVQCGNQVLAAAGGTVTFAGWHQFGGGNRVVVDHGNGLSTSYNHMSSIDVKVGQTVDRGTIVGLSGTTGASTGCHLHFEVIIDDETVDPMAWL